MSSEPKQKLPEEKNTKNPFQPLYDLRWHTVRVDLRNIKNTYARQHPLAVFAAIFKFAATKSGVIRHEDFFYHPLEKPVNDRIYKNMVYPLEVVFLNSSRKNIVKFVDALSTYLEDPGNNFSLHHTEPVRCRNLDQLLQEQPLVDEHEICLDFITPFPFPPKKKSRRHLIDKDIFFRKLAVRISDPFSIRLPGISKTWADVKLLPYYWEYFERSRTAGNNGRQFLNGTVGPLYIKGEIKKIYPLLLICSELNSGRRRAFGLGHYILEEKQPFFDIRLADEDLFLKFHQEFHAVSDHADELTGELLEPGRVLKELHQSLVNGKYQAGAALTADIPKKDGRQRTIAILKPEDHLVHSFLLSILRPVLDRMFEDGVVGFRPNRSRLTARRMIIEAFHEGFGFALKADIASFFDQIDWQILSAKIAAALPESDRRTRALLAQCIRTRLRGPDGMVDRACGLLQGSPLSPLLANLYLDSFDENMAGLGHRLIRYGDDFLIMVRSMEEGKVALADIKALLAQLKLSLKEEKTALQPLDMGFTFLGLEFGAMIDEEFIERIALKKTLFIQEQFGFLGVDGNSVIIKKGGALLARLPIHRISGIVIFGTTSLSTRLLQSCSRLHIPVSFCSPAGYYINTLKPDSRRYFRISADHTARHGTLTEQDKIRIAAEVVTAKIENYLVWLQYRREPAIRDVCRQLDKGIAGLDDCETVEQVRGHEGWAAKLIFSAVNPLVKDSFFRTDTRICHRRADPYNSLLDFAFFLLFCKLNVLVRTRGLNPYLGVLHSSKDTYESLVSDLQEMFRYRMDRMLIRMINLRMIKPEDFENMPEGGQRLNHKAAGSFLDYFAREMSLQLNHEPGTLKQLLVAQVSVISRWAAGNDRLIFFNLRNSTADRR